MEIVNVRIDDRLIHAQIAAVWVMQYKPDRIVVIDDGAAQDDIQQVALKMSCPKSVKLSILTVESAVGRLKENSFENERIFIICRGPKTIQRVIEKGYFIPTVTIGNINSREDSTIQIKRSIVISTEQFEIFKALMDKGVSFITQLIPSEPSEDFAKLIEGK